jgi:hypothetical protein
MTGHFPIFASFVSYFAASRSPIASAFDVMPHEVWVVRKNGFRFRHILDPFPYYLGSVAMDSLAC